MRAKIKSKRYILNVFPYKINIYSFYTDMNTENKKPKYLPEEQDCKTYNKLSDEETFKTNRTQIA